MGVTCSPQTQDAGPEREAGESQQVMKEGEEVSLDRKQVV
jgi:hypothetical protein